MPNAISNLKHWHTNKNGIIYYFDMQNQSFLFLNGFKTNKGNTPHSRHQKTLASFYISPIYTHTCSAYPQQSYLCKSWVLYTIISQQNLHDKNRSLERNNTSLIYQNHWIPLMYIVYLTTWIITEAIEDWVHSHTLIS